MKKKRFLWVTVLTVALLALGVAGCQKKENTDSTTGEKVTPANGTEVTSDETSQSQSSATQPSTDSKPIEKVDIIDLNSTDRPIAISVNNTPIAVEVQTGLNKAYLVYEIPTEGYTSRLLALYKDITEDITVGTARSARHNFIDVCLESNALLVHFGWSHYAQGELTGGALDYINGLFDSPFWRHNPEGLPSEHTAYTSLNKIKEYAANTKGYSLTAKDTSVFKYNVSDVDLSKRSDAIMLNSVKLPYSSYQNTVFRYDEATKTYLRFENGEPNIDYNTKEQFNTKNIIIQKVEHKFTDDGYYWDLKTVGSGEGYYITNGYAVPITWSKSSREAKTVFKYADGREIELSDGRTYVEMHATDMEITLNY